jgi:hypothetical protein
MRDPDRHVPMGTVWDQFTASPKPVLRDYDTAVIPGLVLDEENVGVLIDSLTGIREAIREYKARVAAEEAEDEPDARGLRKLAETASDPAGPCCWRAVYDSSAGWWCSEHRDQP